MIGDLNTVTLVGTDATIDWFCPPRLDSHSAFGALLDRERGGYYRIAPAAVGLTSKQLYLPDTNVLVTRFLGKGGVGEIQDFMPVQDELGGRRLTRQVLAVRFPPRSGAALRPRPRRARGRPVPEGAVFAPGGDAGPRDVVDARWRPSPSWR